MIELFRKAIVDSLHSTFPHSVNIAPFAGQITPAELARLGMNSPALRVAVLGTDGTESKGGAPHATLAMAIFIITATGSGGQPAEAAALKLVGHVLAHTVGNRWGMDAAIPTNVRAENCHTGELNANNTALWAVTFKQSVDISSCLILPELDDFLRCYVTHGTDDTAPTDIITLKGASHAQSTT
ncbi:MAG: hypothetical protein RRY29_11350 [Desulfovibrionaceae bacterium]